MAWEDVPPGRSDPAADSHENHLQVGIHGALPVHEKPEIRPHGGRLRRIYPGHLPHVTRIDAAHLECGGHVKILEPSHNTFKALAVLGDEFLVFPPFLEDHGNQAFQKKRSRSDSDLEVLVGFSGCFALERIDNNQAFRRVLREFVDPFPGPVHSRIAHVTVPADDEEILGSVQISTCMNVLATVSPAVHPEQPAQFLGKGGVVVLGAQGGQEGPAEPCFHVTPLASSSHVSQGARPASLQNLSQLCGNLFDGLVPGNFLEPDSVRFQRMG